MINYLKKLKGIDSSSTNAVRQELTALRKEVNFFKQKYLQDDHDVNISSESENDETEDDVEALIEQRKISVMKKGARSSVSAEVYGLFNKKAEFTPNVIKKSAEQIHRIKEKVLSSILFSTLEEDELKTVIDAMDERKYSAGDFIINEGENGDELFLIETGTFDCTKLIDGKNIVVKKYNPGQYFGELALLYNSPRQASIQAKEDCILWALDRETFNHIVKGAAMKKREVYENFLRSVDILSTIDSYEITQICDAVQTKKFAAGEYIIKQNQQGNEFYIVAEGELTALKRFDGKNEEESVMDYKVGNYFGELALIRNEPRAASIKAMVVC